MSKRKSSSPPVLPGYTYIRPLGSGGFADVFLYEQDMPRRVVAVKVLADDAINPAVLRTFNAEADILARLSAHPSIVTIYQASISADGRPYFVMEYCPDTMSSRYKKAPLSVAEALDTGVRMAAALETAHRSDVLHRDIKPSNILITTLDSPALADFGIASALHSADESPEVFAMSLPWSSPEVILENTNGTVSSEIWGLGATLFTLLAGRTPFEPTDGPKLPRDELKRRIVHSAPFPLQRVDIPKRLSDALARSLSKRPDQRFATMLEFAEELRWAQYDAGLSPTAFDVAAQEWAAAAGPLASHDDSRRGPLITTVNPDSRRAIRAQHLASEERRRVVESRRPRVRSPRSIALMGALVGAGAMALVLVAVWLFGGFS